MGVEIPPEGITPLQEFNRDTRPLTFLDASVVAEAFLHHANRKVDKGGCISFHGRKYETTTETTTQTTTTTTTTETTTETTTAFPIVTVDLTQEAGVNPVGTAPNGKAEVIYQEASDDYLLNDTSSNCAATWTNSFEPISSGKVVVRGYAIPMKVSGKWAFVQIKGLDENGNVIDIADLASDSQKAKNIALRTGGSKYISSSNGIVANHKYEYEFIIDLDNQTVQLTVDGTVLNGTISAKSVNAVYNITATKDTDRNLVVSKPVVGVPYNGGETTTETSTESTTETTTETSTETTTRQMESHRDVS